MRRREQQIPAEDFELVARERVTLYRARRLLPRPRACRLRVRRPVQEASLLTGKLRSEAALDLTTPDNLHAARTTRVPVDSFARCGLAQNRHADERDGRRPDRRPDRVPEVAAETAVA
jgi:hypothetical protein